MKNALSDLATDLERLRSRDIAVSDAALGVVELPLALGLFTRYLGHVIAFAWLSDLNDWTHGYDDVDFQCRLTTDLYIVDVDLSHQDEMVVRWAAAALGLLVGACYVSLTTTWWAQLLLAANIGVCIVDPIWGVRDLGPG